jgi:uncharacterized protein (TIGR00288 family)
MVKEKLIIFVDGSNYYHSLKKAFNKTKINFQKLSNYLSINYNLVQIYFYSAPLLWQEMPKQYSKQQKYFEKIKLVKRLKLILGRLERRNNKKFEKIKQKYLSLLSYLNTKNISEIKLFNELKEDLENYSKFGNKVEKGVDVNLAVDLVTLAFEKKYDVAIIISNDGDFVPAVEKAQAYGKKVYNVRFAKCNAHHLSKVCDKTININEISDFLIDT